MPRIAGIRRLFRLRLPGRVNLTEIDDELRFHIETRADELIAGGMTATDARATALREFGNVAAYRDDVATIDHQYAREQRMRLFIESVTDDLRYAWFALRAHPGFSLLAVFTLVMGIGATTSVFSVVRGVLLRPLPYANADRVVHVGERDIARPGRGGNTSFDNFTDWQKMSSSFVAMGLFNTWQPTLTGRGQAARVEVAGVTAGIFDVFDARPFLGRRFVASDNANGAAAVVVVSYDFWRTRLGADSGAIGQKILINFAPAEVVGVLRPDFSAPGSLNRPIWFNFSDDTDGRAGRSKAAYALLKPGVTVDQAQDDMQRVSAQLAEQYPKENKGSTAVVAPLSDRLIGDLRRPLYMMLAASFLVLLIACANLSNLLLTRGVARGRELAVRVALGAGRARIVRQLLTESVLLAAIGCVGGVIVASVATGQLLRLGPPVFATRPPSMDLTVLAGAVAVAVCTTLLFGLVPAFRSAPRDPPATLRASSRAGGGQTARLRTGLAVAQLSLAVVLLSVSTMVISSFARVLRVEPGIRGDHLLTASMNLPRARYDSSKSTVFYQRVAERVRGLPGVEDVAFTSLIAFSGDYDRIGIARIAGEPEHSGSDAPEGDRYIVTPSYFETMGVRLVKGRLFTDDDRYDGAVVCLVDEVFARRTWGNADPIGKQMQLPMRTEFATIVGVVTHVKTYGLEVESPGQIYMSNVQYPWRWTSIVVRTTGDPMAFLPTLTRVVQELDPDQPVSTPATMETMMGDLLRARQFTLTLLATFAGVAIALAVIGLYGVIAYGVSQRRREFSIRLALGAQRIQIARMVVGEGGRIALIGAVLGAAGAFGASKLVSTLLFEVSARDVMLLTLVSAGLVAVAMLACVMPARRATAVQPADVLRGD
ncbi:MAG TPA: ABC transporter permease [Gemmatimonadaceae bacterium]|nr:ABC transporter permease [Gemmatimonadaceae bacterium]